MEDNMSGMRPFQRQIMQKSLSKPVTCKGVGVHSGAEITMTLKPAEANSGITFIRTDLSGNNEIPAKWDFVVDTRMCTVISNEVGAMVGTIEHLMAALAGLGIDNAIVELDGAEVPIMDGSSAPFIFLIECAGIEELTTPRQMIRVLKTVEVQDGDKIARLEPSAKGGLTMTVGIDFDNGAIGKQDLDFTDSNGAFKMELSRARTFGFYEDVEMLRKMGLGQGGSLDNAIIIRDDEVMNEGGLRYQDEFVRHKALDAVGDLWTGGAIAGHFTGVKAGHAMHNLVLKALFADDSNWCFDPATILVSEAEGQVLAAE